MVQGTLSKSQIIKVLYIVFVCDAWDMFIVKIKRSCGFSHGYTGLGLQ